MTRIRWAQDAAERRTIGCMWLRRAFYGWLIPAAFILPLWLLVGWGVFNAGGWAFLWVLFLAIPGVFLWQLLLTLLVRARGTVQGASRGLVVGRPRLRRVACAW